jgi:tripartite-type tricarboxylate transporter receptor subunit TctC
MKKKLYAILAAFVMSLATMNYAWSKDVIEIVVPTAPGGAVDTTARAISAELKNHGYDNIVTYHPGAGGELATRRVLEKGNNIIFVASMANFVFQDVTLNRPNQLSKTMLLYGPTVTNSMAFFVAGTNDITLTELIKNASDKEQPCGVSNNHGEIILQAINKQYGTKFLPIMYKGTGQLIPDVVGGHVPCAFDQTAPYTKLGDRVRWVGTSDSNRVKPGVPTLAAVLKGFQFTNWYATAIPKNSNLKQDPSITKILTSWSGNPEIVKPLIDQGFNIAKADKNLNIRASDETDYYRKLLSN